MVDFKALSAPFEPEDVQWRVGSTTKDKSKGMALAYLDARAVMDRLDAVCGPDSWQCKYSHANGKTVCDIGVWCKLPKGGEWIWKADGAGDSDIEAEKGALSDAFKRAAVRAPKLSPSGRYLAIQAAGKDDRMWLAVLDLQTLAPPDEDDEPPPSDEKFHAPAAFRSSATFGFSSGWPI